MRPPPSSQIRLHGIFCAFSKGETVSFCDHFFSVTWEGREFFDNGHVHRKGQIENVRTR